MSATTKIIRYQLSDVARSKQLLFYMLFFLAVTEALFRFGGGGAKALISLSNIALFVIPLVSIVFGTMYLYGAREFIELLLTQPIDRKRLFGGLYVGLALPLSGAFLVGMGAPFALRGGQAAAEASSLLAMAASSVLLTFIFAALAFLIATQIEDKVRGLGASMLLWLLFSVIYDGLVLLAAGVFSEYPLEKPMLALMFLNPIDLGRVLLILTFDISALMGYTGAAVERFFGSAAGAAASVSALLVWIVAPLAFGMRRFGKKDF